MHLTHWDIAVWIGGGLGYIALAVVFLIKKRYRTFPWFSTLLASQMTQSIILASMSSPHHYELYFYTYWFGEVVNAVILIAVTLELAKSFSQTIDIFDPQFFRNIQILAWVVPIASAVGVLCLKLLPDLHHELANLAFKIDTVCGFLMMGLVGSISLAMYFYGMRCRVHVAALTYGLFVYAVGRMLVFAVALNVQDVYLWRDLERWLKPTYVVIQFIWCLVLWVEEPQRKLTGLIGDFLSKFGQLATGTPRSTSSMRSATTQLPMLPRVNPSKESGLEIKKVTYV